MFELIILEKLIFKRKERGCQLSVMSSYKTGHRITELFAHRCTYFSPRLHPASDAKIWILIRACHSAPVISNIVNQPSFHVIHIAIHVLHLCCAWRRCISHLQEHVIVRVHNKQNSIYNLQFVAAKPACSHLPWCCHWATRWECPIQHACAKT